MKYIVRRKQAEVGSNIYIYTLHVDGTYIASSAAEEKVMSIFREFCNAKAAGTLHDKTELTVCQLINPKGQHKVTKKYYYIDKVVYRIYKKYWFLWFEVYKFRNHDPHDEDMPVILNNYVNEGIASSTVPETIAEC